MKTAGIICEYNPFHAGHRYQISRIREQLGEETGVLCLMSGNYVQRGEPAVYDKRARAGDALRGGADLVLELPLTAAVNGAGYFAAGAVDCLEDLGMVDRLCFGSEFADLDALLRTARVLNGPDFEEALREALKTGMSFPAAREEALRALGGDGACLTRPNSALAVDYLRRLLERNGNMTPLVIPRDMDLPSATQCRAALIEAGAPIHTLQNGERAMLAVLRTLPDSAFEQAPFGGEGLWSKVMRSCRRGDTLEEILFACKSKRYTLSRLKRMLLCLYLGLSAGDLRRKPPYLRVLAFNDRGREMLRRMKETSAMPILTRHLPPGEEAEAYFALERRASDLYGLFAPPGTAEPVGREKTEGPVYLRG